MIIVPLTQISFIADNFWGRVTSSFTTDDPNADSRFKQYEMAWEYFTQHPLNGSMINSKFYFDESMNKIPPHSFILQLLATQGIIGFVVHTFLISLILYISYKNRRDSYSFQMFLLILFYLVFTMLNENFYSSRNILMFNFAAALILYRNKCIENAKNYILSITSNGSNSIKI
jgi:O-antigen ligase